MPDAMPRRRVSNHADMSATEGTSTQPPPRPVMSRADRRGQQSVGQPGQQHTRGGDDGTDGHDSSRAEP